MEIQTVGPWFLLVLGALTIIGALVYKMVYPEGGKTLMMYVFGVLLGGLGIWGPDFMTPYKDWLGVLSDLVTDPGQESVAAFLDIAGEERMPAELKEIGLDYIVENASPEMEAALNEAIEATPVNSDFHGLLSNALIDLRGKQAAADLLLDAAGRTGTGVQDLQHLDSSTREMIFQRMELRRPQELQQLNINPNDIRRIRPTRPIPPQ
ncbi:hypothetical protein ACFL41_01795 [Gemmatimonadota bacterium]